MIRVSAWEDDPQSVPAARPIGRPVPVLKATTLGIALVGPQPAPRLYRPGTAGFRFWSAADALTRGARYWAGVVPGLTRWHAGPVLPVSLDEGADLNAYYDRQGLCFFHATVRGVTVYSGESPDVLCHELGHAALDAASPALWDAASIEVAALHEAFGDISAMLSALELESVRRGVIEETDGRLAASSRISRLAEQLGWAVRQSRPDAVERDCLRNASNSFFYSEPEGLPPIAPASSLSSEPHSFCRVFTAAWLDALAGMVDQAEASAAALHAVARDAGALLVRAVQQARIASNYFAQVAAHVIRADAELLHGRYREPIRRAFVGRGILSPASAFAVVDQLGRRQPPTVRHQARPTAILRLPIDGETYGLRLRHVLVEAPLASERSAAASAAPDLGSQRAATPERAGLAFVEDLLRRDRVDPGHLAVVPSGPVRRARATHALVRRGGAVKLVRRRFHRHDSPRG